jgi:hypothetical protein
VALVIQDLDSDDESDAGKAEDDESDAGKAEDNQSDAGKAEEVEERVQLVMQEEEEEEEVNNMGSLILEYLDNLQAYDMGALMYPPWRVNNMEGGGVMFGV